MFLASLIAGGAGALLSVLYGMTSGNLRLHTLFANAESGLGPLVAAGALRPLLGALSGIVVYVLLQSGLRAAARFPTAPRARTSSSRSRSSPASASAGRAASWPAPRSASNARRHRLRRGRPPSVKRRGEPRVRRWSGSG